MTREPDESMNVNSRVRLLRKRRTISAAGWHEHRVPDVLLGWLKMTGSVVLPFPEKPSGTT
jgi:hypothetical protein